MSLRDLICLTVVLAITSSAAIATPVNFGGTWVEVEYWGGSGSNEAIIVIDFGVDSYAFGYKWDTGPNPKYGKDMMDAAVAAGSMSYTQSGGFLNTISYDGYSNIGENGWPTDWWAYFISTDGQSWADPGEGFATRELTNGAWDAWAHQPTGDWPPAHVPTTPIPEPVTIALLALGGLILRRGKTTPQ